MSEIVKSYFIPDSCLQGSEIPIHIIWDPEKKVKVKVLYPPDIMEIKEIYNVKREHLEYKPGYLLFSAFEKNGYIGLLFKSKFAKESSIKKSIHLTLIEDNDIKEEIMKEIFFFRPDIIASKPTNIMISEEGQRLKMDSNVIIENLGSGTAIIAINTDKESDVKLRMPEDVEEFIQRLYTILVEKLNEIKTEFPENSMLIDDFIDILKFPLELTDELVKKYDKIKEKLKEAFEKNEEFLKRFAESFFIAYISSIHLITDLRGFLEYLRSIAKQRIILYNAMSILELKPGINKLIGHLMITDLASNYYEPVDITVQIDVKTNERIRIPLYLLFKYASVR